MEPPPLDPGVDARESAAALPRESSKMRGFVDYVSGNNIRGWVFDPQAVSHRIQVRLTLRTEVLVEGITDQPRPDVGHVFGTDGTHGFRFAGLDLSPQDVARVAVEARSSPESPWKPLRRRPGLRAPRRKSAGRPMPITVIGTSHVSALRYALPPEHGRFILINISQPHPKLREIFPSNWREPDDRYVELLKEELRPNSHFISMLGGNDHNSIGLIEHPQRFDFLEPGQDVAEIEPERDLIPYDALRAMLQRRLDSYLRWLSELAPVFAGKKLHLCSPPPVPSGMHIKKFPDVFERIVSRGVTPARIRAKLYNINSDIFREGCSRLGVEFVPPPSMSLDGGGFLRPEYWNSDPTHANVRYGRLLLKQIKEHVAS
jgi:hypothetical protein